MRTALLAVLGAAALLLGLDKVRNEHRMTEMYERQAVALEKLAGVPAPAKPLAASEIAQCPRAWYSVIYTIPKRPGQVFGVEAHRFELGSREEKAFVDKTPLASVRAFETYEACKQPALDIITQENRSLGQFKDCARQHGGAACW